MQKIFMFILTLLGVNLGMCTDQNNVDRFFDGSLRTVVVNLRKGSECFSTYWCVQDLTLGSSAYVSKSVWSVLKKNFTLDVEPPYTTSGFVSADLDAVVKELCFWLYVENQYEKGRYGSKMYCDSSMSNPLTFAQSADLHCDALRRWKICSIPATNDQAGPIVEFCVPGCNVVLRGDEFFWTGERVFQDSGVI